MLCQHPHESASWHAHSPCHPPTCRRVYKSRAKNAQEAHEAIRPTDPGLDPGRLPASLTPDQRALYGLIWRRTLACQMESARTETVGAAGVGRGGGGAVLHALTWRAQSVGAPPSPPLLLPPPRAPGAPPQDGAQVTDAQL